MIIGMAVAAVGSFCAYALVRQADFVPSYSAADGAPDELEVVAH